MTKPGSQTRPHFFYVALLTALTLLMTVPGIFNLPVIDRDEARYAQATVQMVESGDYLNINFQDEPRHKKPAGIYWMQAAAVKTFTEPGERRIWAQRLPSVLGALLAVLATYWGALRILGRRGAFIAGGFLATSALFVFEAHIAKTDAMLCGMTALMLAALLRLRQAPSKTDAFLLWLALGGSIMIKGPIGPALLILTLVSLAIWERQAAWMKRLFSWPGLIALILMTVPWAVMIWIETDGAFFKTAIGSDLAPKLAGGQEKHGAPPGYYLLTLPVLFWPGILVLISGLTFAARAARANGEERDGAMAKAMRLLLCWSLPFWLILEIVPTKLPNYLLPVYPALSIMAAGAVIAMLSWPVFGKTRKAGAFLYLIVGMALITLILSAESMYAQASPVIYVAGALILLGVFVTAVLAWRAKLNPAAVWAIVTTLTISAMTYTFVLPRSTELRISDAVQNALQARGIDLPRQGGQRVFSPHFTEPSLVYRLGTEILLGDKAENAWIAGLDAGDTIIIDAQNSGSETALRSAQTAAAQNALCLTELDNLTGLNYSKGDPVDLRLYQAESCETNAR